MKRAVAEKGKIEGMSMSNVSVTLGIASNCSQ